MMLTDQEKIELISRVIIDINEIKDLDVLLEKILTSVRMLFNADAGSIYLRHGNDLKFSYTQNDTLQKNLPSGNKLIYNTFSVPINDDSIAGYVAQNHKVLNIPDVYEIDTTVPYLFNSSFDKKSKYRTCSMLSVPMINQRSELLGVLQIINAKSAYDKIISFTDRDEIMASNFAASAALAIERTQMTRDIILRMISLTELHDPKETEAHVNRVSAYAVEIYEQWARKKNIPEKEIERQKDSLRMAAMLHDVGKVAISDLVLKKPAKLSAEEFAVMQSHTYLGARLFKDVRSNLDEMAKDIALNHHEKWDGTGYPGHIDFETGEPLPGYVDENGKPRPKKGEEIPIFGRIVAVADVFDALTSQRVYKEPWPEKKVLDEMQKSAGKNFDPEVIAAFFDSLDVLKSIRDRYNG